jgi:hypothetical protein
MWPIKNYAKRFFLIEALRQVKKLLPLADFSGTD